MWTHTCEFALALSVQAFVSLRDNEGEDDLRDSTAGPAAAFGVGEMPKIAPKSLSTGETMREAEPTVRTLPPTELQYFQVGLRHASLLSRRLCGATYLRLSALKCHPGRSRCMISKASTRCGHRTARGLNTERRSGVARARRALYRRQAFEKRSFWATLHRTSCRHRKSSRRKGLK